MRKKKKNKEDIFYEAKKHSFSKTDKKFNKEEEASEKKISDDIRLNRYIAMSGICSRREADSLIEKGKVKVNGKIVNQVGTKVKLKDTVTVDENVINPHKPVYYLVNKPKDVICTTDDPQGRRTILDIIQTGREERIYPVGRLDRNTTGLILLTNDGDLSKKLTHPSHQISKVYEVTLNRKLNKKDIEKIEAGVELEDGMVKVDDLAITDESGKVLGLEIHIGRNRIVRRLFEHLGYEVMHLDRVVFAGLTKKDLPRGKWRRLRDSEVNYLKMLK